MKKIYLFIIVVFALSMTSCTNTSENNLYADVSAALLNQRVMMDDLYESFKTQKYSDAQLEDAVDSIISKAFDETIAKYDEETVVEAINEISNSNKKGDKVINMEQMHLMGKLIVKKIYKEEYQWK